MRTRKAPARARLWRLILGWAIVLILVAARVVSWWHSLPHTLHLRGAFTTLRTPLVSDAGFVVQDSRTSFTGYDWNGKRQWTVQTPGERWRDSTSLGNVTEWRPPYTPGTSIASSPTGHFFATGVFRTPDLCVTSWQDGTAVWQAQIPLEQWFARMDYSEMGAITFFQRDDGRIMVKADRLGMTRHTWLVLVDQEHQFSAGFSADCDISPDGAFILRSNINGNHTCYTYAVTAGKLQLSRYWTQPSSVNSIFDHVLYGGAVMTDNGLYTGASHVITGKGWWQNWPDPDTARPIFYKDSPSGKPLDRMRVIDPAGKNSWYVPLPPSTDYNPAISRDGSRVMGFTSSPADARLHARLSGIPGMKQFFDRSYWDSRLLAEIYREPGVLEARVLTHGGIYQTGGATINLTDAKLAPHDRRLLANYHGDYSGRSHAVYLLSW